MIVLVNKSTLVSNTDAAVMARAVSDQLRYHVAPAWKATPIPVVFLSTVADAPPGAWVIGLLDDPDQADALGWHTEAQGSVIFGRVFARPVLDNGGDVLHAALSVASVFSHEAIETMCDPHVNLWADVNGTLIAVEACDPVEAGSYAVDGITVSNFVTPAWFDTNAAHGTRLDHLGQTHSPGQIASGGYCVKMIEGKVSQVFGDDYPEWRKATKSDPSRTSRRVPGSH